MLFQLNFKSAKAVYLQLVDQVKAASASGAVRPGDPLPGIRPLAEELRVNRNTVAKAYAELESQGIVESLAGRGCFVRANGSPFRKDVRRKLVAEKSLESRRLCEQRGLVISEIDYPAFRKATQPVYTEFRPKIGAEFVDKVIEEAGA